MNIDMYNAAFFLKVQCHHTNKDMILMGNIIAKL